MDTRSVSAAAIAAALGAAAWAAVAYFMEIEIGWLALGIGFLVGAAAQMFGGEGKGMGAVCAVLSIVSILIGKCVMMEFIVQHELDVMLNNEFDKSFYQEQMEDARQYQLVENDNDLRSFMVIREYTQEKDPQKLGTLQLGYFKEYEGEMLDLLHEWQPSFEDWKAMHRKTMSKTFSRGEVYAAALHPMDMFFALLAVSAAWRLGKGDAA